MMHLMHQAEIVWRENQREQEREAEFRRIALERATDDDPARPLRDALGRLRRRIAALRPARA
jgi:hypothetical protein